MNWQQVGKLMVGTSLALGAAAGFAQPYPQVPRATNDIPDSIENYNYGVCSTYGSSPEALSCYHNWGVQRFTSAQYPNGKVLLYTRTAGPRHQSIGTALAAGLNPPLNANNNSQLDLIRLLGAQGIGVDYTEDVRQLTNLNQYAAIIFFDGSRESLWNHGNYIVPALAVSTSTDAYLDQAKVNLRQYMRAGGGFVGVHNAYGTEYDWPWFEGLLGNANYYDHGGFRPGSFEVVAADPSTAGIGATYQGNPCTGCTVPAVGAVGTIVPFEDEWYTMVPFPTNVKFLTSLVMSTQTSSCTGLPCYTGAGLEPVTWCHYYDGGRAWLTVLGHDLSATSDLTIPYPIGSSVPNRAQFESLLVNGIMSAMGLIPFCT
jgi:type 1 glutamine amidotransferase